MNRLEKSIKKSFTRVKMDILEVKNQILNLAERQEELAQLINKKTKEKEKYNPKKIKVVRARTARKSYVATKEGKKFHIPECPFAQNIKPKSKVKFKSKTNALNKGFKPCNCVK